jgi:dolichyl-phosphate-mannose-protein mannosyltransferase
MDVHPPLAKLMITYISEVFMYNGSFPFKNIGDSIPSNVPYIQMRMLNALLGVALIPISFHTIKALGFSSITAFVTGILVTCENSLATQSRLILLDAPLLLFTGFTLLSWAKFQQYQKKPFTDEWWKWLTYTGIGLGLVSSVKWVGLFSVATIGLCTLNNLWNILGNLENSMKKFVKHFMARALCLIVIPVSIYAFFFLIHFLVLNKSGSGAAFMSQNSKLHLSIPPFHLLIYKLVMVRKLLLDTSILMEVFSTPMVQTIRLVPSNNKLLVILIEIQTTFGLLKRLIIVLLLNLLNR